MSQKCNGNRSAEVFTSGSPVCVEYPDLATRDSICRLPRPCAAKHKELLVVAGKHTSLSIDQLVIDAAFQIRVGGLNSEHADDLATVLEINGALPAVKVCVVKGIGNIVTDGFHTVEAHKRAGKPNVPCIVSQGTHEEAMLAAAMANREHDRSGLKRTSADKRRAVALTLATVGGWSDHFIAGHVGVSHTFVGKVRKEQSNSHQLERKSSLPSSESLRVGADGKSRGPKHLAAPRPITPAPSNAATPLKSGAELPSKERSWRVIETNLGGLIRGLDELATQCGCQGAHEYKQMSDLLNNFAELWHQSRNRIMRPKQQT